MRFQRRTHRGSRPIPDVHPSPTQHTAESYFARYRSSMTWNRLVRYRRLQRREKGAEE